MLRPGSLSSTPDGCVNRLFLAVRPQPPLPGSLPAPAVEQRNAGPRASPRSSVGSPTASTMTTSSSRDSGEEWKSLSRPASDSVLLSSLMRITPTASHISLAALAPRPRGRPAQGEPGVTAVQPCSSVPRPRLMATQKQGVGQSGARPVCRDVVPGFRLVWVLRLAGAQGVREHRLGGGSGAPGKAAHRVSQDRPAGRANPGAWGHCR